MRDTVLLSNVRDRSRSARERSRSLRLTSQQLRDSVENLRVYTAGGNGELRQAPGNSAESESSSSAPRTALDSAALMRQRVWKARAEAQALRRRAVDLRTQAASFRARSENLHGKSAPL